MPPSFQFEGLTYYAMRAGRRTFKFPTPCFDYLAIYSVSNAKNPCAQCFFYLRCLESYGESFLGQLLILFVRENYCNCASCMKFCTNEFFKHAYKISKTRPHKRIFDARKWTLHSQCMRCHRTITRPKLPKSSKHGVAALSSSRLSRKFGQVGELPETRLV